MTPAGGRARLVDLLLTALLAAAPLFPALLTGRSLYYRDIGQYYIPNRFFTVQAIHAGHFPLWNPQRNSGQPFLANPNSFVLRPTTLLFLAFPARLVHIPMTLSVMALFITAALGTRALLSDCGFSRAASLLGAAAFSLSGPVQSLGQLQNHLEGVAFLPATLWALRRSFLRGWNPWGIIAGFFFGLVVSAGEPVWIAVTFLGVFALPGMEGVEARRAARPALAASAIGLLVASAQLLPLIENAFRSERGGGLQIDEVLKWSLPPQAMLQTVIPGLWGDPSRLSPTAYWGTWLFESSLPWLLSIHLGAPILLLAAAGSLAAKRGVAGRAAALAIVGAVLALGRFTPLYPLLVNWVPGAANVRFPVKWIVLTAWCVAVLAAMGFDRMAARARPTRDRYEIAGSLAAAAGLVLGVVMATGGMPAASGLVRSLLNAPASLGDDLLAEGAVRSIGAGIALTAGSVLILLLLSPRETAHLGLCSGLAAGLCVAILLTGAWGLNPSAPPGTVFAPSPLLKAMPEVEEGRLRFFGFPRPPGFAFRTVRREEAEAAGLPQDSIAWGMQWDVRTLRYATFFSSGAKGAYDRTGDSRLDLLPGSSLGLRIKEGMSLPEAIRFLSASSVGYLLSHRDLAHPELTEAASLADEANVPVKLYRIASPAPRAELVDRAIEVSSLDAALGEIGSGAADPRRVVLLGPPREEELAGAPPQPPAAGGGEGPGSAAITRDDPCQVSIQVSARWPSWLVLTDTFEPSWRATLDGAPAPVRRANAMFRAVKVPAGDHEVVFAYTPRSFLAGCLVSLGTAAAGACLIFMGGRKGFS